MPCFSRKRLVVDLFKMLPPFLRVLTCAVMFTSSVLCLRFGILPFFSMHWCHCWTDIHVLLLCRLRNTVLMDLNSDPSFQRTIRVSSAKKCYKKATKSSDCRWDPTSERPRQAWHRPVSPDRSSWNRRRREWTANGYGADLPLAHLWRPVWTDGCVPAQDTRYIVVQSFYHSLLHLTYVLELSNTLLFHIYSVLIRLHDLIYYYMLSFKGSPRSYHHILFSQNFYCSVQLATEIIQNLSCF